MPNAPSDDQIFAKAILDAVVEGAGHLFTPDEIDWALQVTGDIPVAEMSMISHN